MKRGFKITGLIIGSLLVLMIAAGLVAKNAVELGLRVPKYLKTSPAPG